MTRETNMISKKLQPEYARAVDFLDKNLNRCPNYSKLDSCNLLDGSFKLFEKRFPIKQIPSGKCWRWNQTNARKEVTIPHRNATVKILKLIPRKRNTIVVDDSDIPSFKVWQYEVISPNAKPIFALWCEKGLQNVDICKESRRRDHEMERSEIEIESETEYLDLEVIWDDLSFLSSFMAPTVAQSFWPRNVI